MMRCIRSLAAATLLVATTSGCLVQTAKQRQREAIDLYVQSQLHIDAENETAALRALLMAIEVDPQLSTAHAAIGDIHRGRGDYESAVRAYERAVDVNAWNFRNHYNCASLHQHLADADKDITKTKRHLDRAVELYSRAILLNKKDYDSRLNLGACYFQLEEYEQAQEYCRQAIDLDDSLPHAFTNLGAVLDRLGKNYDAIAMYNKSLERNSRQPNVLMNLGAAYRRVGKPESAVRSYQQALELAPASAEILERLGYCHFFKTDYEQSLEFYQAAIAADSRMALAHRGIGIVYMTLYLQDRDDLNSRARAIEHWRISLEIDPNQASLAELLSKYAGP